MKDLGLSFWLVCQWPQTPTGSLMTSLLSPHDNVLMWNTLLFNGPSTMKRSTSRNGPLSLERHGIVQHPMCIDPVPSWQQASSIWCVWHEPLHHTSGRVDENWLDLPLNVPVCSAMATSTAAGNRGRSIGNYGCQESAGSAIGPPLITRETAWMADIN